MNSYGLNNSFCKTMGKFAKTESYPLTDRLLEILKKKYLTQDGRATYNEGTTKKGDIVTHSSQLPSALYLSCSNIEDEDLVCLKNCTTLGLSNCDLITNVSSLGGVHQLCLSYYHNIADLSPLSHVHSLVLHGHKLKDLSIFSHNTTLDLTECEGVEDISPLAKSSTLETLRLESTKIADISPLAESKTLVTLDLWECSEITDISPLCNIPTLTHLVLSRCYGITDISSLEKAQALESLELACCYNITDVSSLANCSSLTYLQLSSSHGVENVSTFASSNIERLEIDGCTKIADVDVAALAKSKITYLDLSFCTDITDVSSLGESKTLETLVLNDCTGIADVSALGKSTSLKKLYLIGCTGLTSVSSLENIENIWLKGCTGVTDYSAVTHAKR